MGVILIVLGCVFMMIIILGFIFIFLCGFSDEVFCSILVKMLDWFNSF